MTPFMKWDNNISMGSILLGLFCIAQLNNKETL